MSRTSFRGGNAPSSPERPPRTQRRVWRDARTCRTAAMGHHADATPAAEGYARRRSLLRETVTRRVAEGPQGFWALAYATRTLDPLALRKALERWTREGPLDPEARS